MPESAKEGDSVLPEGSDIGLGPGDRAFEPHYSDQKNAVLTARKPQSNTTLRFLH